MGVSTELIRIYVCFYHFKVLRFGWTLETRIRSGSGGRRRREEVGEGGYGFASFLVGFLGPIGEKGKGGY